MRDSVVTTTNSFNINVKVNEVEIITLDTKCSASTIVSDLKEIISKERNITKWETIELKCNGMIMSDDQTLAVYDIICDKHLIYLQINDIESDEIEIEGEQSPIIPNTKTNEPTTTTTTDITTTENTDSTQEQYDKENQYIVIFTTIFLILSTITYIIGLYGICKLRDEWKINIQSYDDEDICIETVNNTLDQIPLTIGGLSFGLAMNIIFLSCCVFLTCNKNQLNDDMMDISLCPAAYWFIALILNTVFSSLFLFGDNVPMIEIDCDTENNTFVQTWTELNPFCYFSYSMILLQWLVMGLLFLCFFCKMMLS